MSARPSDIDLRDMKLPPNRRAVIDAAKQLATFWLGQLAFEEHDYTVAVDFFLKRMLREAPDGILSPAAQYNLARSYEALNEIPKANELYNDDYSPQRFGNRLRARRLQQSLTKTPDSP
jgi:TolA-binding protein